jgi:hypothetical protein
MGCSFLNVDGSAWKVRGEGRETKRELFSELSKEHGGYLGGGGWYLHRCFVKIEGILSPGHCISVQCPPKLTFADHSD